jgi:membrane protein
MKQIWSNLKASYREWNKDDSLRLAAALSYYTVFSIAPLILIVMAIAGFVFGEDAVHGEVSNQLRGLMGAAGAKAVEDIIANAHKPKTGIVATVIGVVVLLVGAMGVFTELKASLNKIWNAYPQKTKGIWAFLRARLLSFAMVLTIGFLLLVSLVINTVLSAASKYFSHYIPLSLGWLDVAYALISLGLVTVLFALIYKVLPERKVEWRNVWSGAFLSSILFTIGKYLIGLYLGKSTVASAFGASASVVIVMVWAYYSSSILLFGAEYVKINSGFKEKRNDTQSENTKQKENDFTEKRQFKTQIQQTG